MSENNNSTTQFEEGALKIERLTPMEVVGTIVGACIGSGCLGTAYASRYAGLPVLIFWLVVGAILSTCSMAHIIECCFRTKKMLQLPGLAEKYLGTSGRILIFVAVTANSLGCLIAYMSGAGNIISELLGIPMWGSVLLFLIPAVGVAWFGLKALGVASKYISVGMIIMLVVLCIASIVSSRADFANVTFANWEFMIPIFNVGTFAFFCQYMAPDLARGMSHNPKKLVPSIAVGYAIATVIMIAIPFSVMLITTPDTVTQVATIAWGQALGTMAFFVANIFALCALCSSYWVIHTSLLTNVVDFFKFKSEWDKKTRLNITIVITLVPAVMVLGNLIGFVDAIYATGAFAGIIMALLPIFMLRSARKNGDIEPSWTCGWMFSPAMQIIMFLVYGITTLYAVFNLLGLLPAGW